jgi:DNA-binding NarL/FixJ family response regulator
MADDARQAVTLSERQMEILALVRSGLRNKEIAHQLGISERTVKWHIKELFTLFGASNRTELATTQRLILIKSA